MRLLHRAVGRADAAQEICSCHHFVTRVPGESSTTAHRNAELQLAIWNRSQGISTRCVGIVHQVGHRSDLMGDFFVLLLIALLTVVGVTVVFKWNVGLGALLIASAVAWFAAWVYVKSRQ